LLDGDFQCRAVRVTNDILLDFAAGEQLVGIEVLGATQAAGQRPEGGFNRFWFNKTLPPKRLISSMC
jgi:hypothetical protein